MHDLDFSDGLTAEITTRLGTIQRLRVRDHDAPVQEQRRGRRTNLQGHESQNATGRQRTKSRNRLLITVNRVDVVGNHL